MQLLNLCIDINQNKYKMSLLENIVERPLNMLRKKNVRDQQFSLKINVSRVERRKVEKKIKIVLCVR